MSHKEREDVVSSTIRLLGLEEIQDSLIGDENVRGISGGQRKRVNLGIEMVARPSILLLDEPTSGLDSGSSMEMIRALKRLAEAKLTIALIIHQPSFSLLSHIDEVILLAKGGRVAFAGPVKSIRPYFEDELGFPFAVGENIVDVAMDALSGIIQSDKEDVDPASLANLWEEKQALVDAPPEEVVDASINGNVVSEQLLPEEMGTRLSFWLAMVGAFFFPPFLISTFYWNRFRTKNIQYGAFLGAQISIMLFTIIALFVTAQTGIGTLWYIGLFIYWTGFATVNLTTSLVALIVWIVLMAKGKKISLALGSHYVMGSALGFFMLPLFLVFDFKEKIKYCTLLAFGTYLVVFGATMGSVSVIIPASRGGGSVANFLPNLDLLAEVMIIGLPTIGFVLISISVSRWRRIPSSDRIISPIWRQIWLQ
jgi:energy-coupling factor transporter ATP-binding protein EcfA2